MEKYQIINALIGHGYALAVVNSRSDFLFVKFVDDMKTQVLMSGSCREGSPQEFTVTRFKKDKAGTYTDFVQAFNSSYQNLDIGVAGATMDKDTGKSIVL